MARLHRRADGGYYIIGPIYGQGSASICTWQVTADGLVYLRSRRLGDRTSVSIDELSELKQRGWVYMLGDGPPTPVGGLSIADVDLLERLVDWSWEGGVTGFDLLIDRGAGRIDVKLADRIFSGPFLRWLSSLVDGALAEFDGISHSDFGTLVAGRLEALPDPLHRPSSLYCEDRLAWRLAEIVGKVAWQVAAARGCPGSWRDSYPLLGHLFDRLTAEERPRSELEGPKPRRRRGLPSTSRPYLWWDVDGQEVIAILPGQVLPPGQELTWSVSGAEVEQPEAFRTEGGARIGESRSTPLDPAERYTIRIETGPGRACVEEVLRLPPVDSPCVLFSEEGRLLPAESGTPHPGGAFLALAPKARAAEIASLPGVRVVEPVDYEPIGWDRWRGFRLEIDEGVVLGPYAIGATGAKASWQAEEPPPCPVCFENSRAVWIARWPRVWIEGEAHFADAVLEVEPEAVHDGPISGVRLWIGDDIPIRHEDGRAYLDLAAAPGLRDVYGSVLLTCRLTALPEHPPLALGLIRLRRTDFAYGEAPQPYDYCSAVRIAPAEPGIVPGTETRITRQGDGCLVWPRDPLGSPSVTVHLPGSQAELRIRTPVTRLRRLARGSPPGPWERPPLLLRLAEAGLDDRLRVELHLLPELEGGRPFCRLVGGAEVSSGVPGRAPNTYDIPLNRWRDLLGREATGTVQLRTTRGWIDLVRLEGREAPPVGRLVREQDDRSLKRRQLVCRLESAVAFEEGDAGLQELGHCVDRALGDDCPLVERELLLLACARGFLHLGRMSEVDRVLAALEAREDLYESTFLRSALELRRGVVPRAEVPGRGRLLAGLPVWCPFQQLLVAEHYSRYACGKGGGVELWQSCLRRLDAILRPAGECDDGGPRSVDTKEALLLHGLATFMIGREPSFPVGLPAQGQWSWLAGLRCAARYLLRPAGRAAATEGALAKLPTPPVFCEEHADLVRLSLHQAAGDVAAAGRLLARFDDLTCDEFFAIDLLRLRQCRMEHRGEDAGMIFRRLLDWARQNEHEPLREVLLEESV